MVNAAIVGLGWWGKNIVTAVQGKERRLRFVRGVTKEIAAARPSPRSMVFRCALTSMRCSPIRTSSGRAGDAAFAARRPDRAAATGRQARVLRKAAVAEAAPTRSAR